MASYALNDEKMFADITDGIAIVINSETGIYYGMNGLGTVVLENILNGSNTDNILAAMQGVEGAPERLGADLQAYVEVLLAKEILIPADGTSNPVSLDIAVTMEDAFVMSVDEYNDAQELLLADPIHEVKEDTGWTPEKDSIGYTKEETAEREKKVEV